MNYTILKDSLREDILSQLSRSASRARSEDGQSMYDSVMPKSRDYGALDASMDQAVEILQMRLANVGVRASYVDNVLAIGLPDLPDAMETQVANAISAYIVMYACDKWIEYNLPDEKEMYDGYLATALTSAIAFLLTRKSVN